ncbi:MAG: recombinase RecT [Dehalococcoidia bacterium]|jgi:recombination protein RecT
MSAETIPMKADPATSLVKSLERSYSSALPTHVTAEHFSRALLTEFRRNPKLMQCTQQSIGGAVLTSAQLGLMLGVLGAAWLVPFKVKGSLEAVLIIGYQGMIDLAYRSDRVESICTDVICEFDEFEFEQGLNQKLKHVPNLKGSRGSPFAVYAIANTRGSTRPIYVVLNAEEIESVKNASPGAKYPDSPWNGKFYTEMWKKTAIRRLCKLLPKSVELVAALDFEDRQMERLKDADATVVDDPLTPGRHTRKPKAQAQAQDATPAAPEQPQEQPEAPADQPADQAPPPDGCSEYQELCRLDKRSPAIMSKALDLARGSKDSCGKLYSFCDIDCADKAQCKDLLDCFRAAQGK